MIAASRGSAKIYVFPTGGRDGMFARSRAFAWTFSFDETKNGSALLSTAGWYHDEAILRDAYLMRKP